MKNKFSDFLKVIFKTENKIIGFFMVLLGFSASCAPEYGSPYAQFNINGKVTSSETGEPIKNIQVKYYDFNSDTTDENGNYSFSFITDVGGNTMVFYIDFNDIDSTINGNYENKSITVSTSNNGYINGDSWYEGEKDIKIDTKLDNKE